MDNRQPFEEKKEHYQEEKTLPGWYYLFSRIFRWSLFFFAIFFFFQPFYLDITFVTIFSSVSSRLGAFLFSLFHLLFIASFLALSFMEMNQKTYMSALTLPLAGIALVSYAPFVPQGTTSGILYFILLAFSFLLCSFECVFFHKTLKERVLFILLNLLFILGTGISMYYGFPTVL